MTKFTNKAQEQVRVFHEAFGHPITEEPTPLKLDRANARSQWGSGEELVEFLHASCRNKDEFKQAFGEFLVGLKKAYHKQADKPFPKNNLERVTAQADAIVDRLYFTFGDAVEIGVDIQPVYDIVQDANMSKLFTDEETGEKYAKYNDEGKIMKSPDFWSPEEKIAEEIERQLNAKQEVDDNNQLEFEI